MRALVVVHRARDHRLIVRRELGHGEAEGLAHQRVQHRVIVRMNLALYSASLVLATSTFASGRPAAVCS